MSNIHVFIDISCNVNCGFNKRNCDVLYENWILFQYEKKKIEIVSSEVSFLGSTYFSIWLVCVAIVR